MTRTSIAVLSGLAFLPLAIAIGGSEAGAATKAQCIARLKAQGMSTNAATKACTAPSATRALKPLTSISPFAVQDPTTGSTLHVLSSNGGGNSGGGRGAGGGGSSGGGSSGGGGGGSSGGSSGM